MAIDEDDEEVVAYVYILFMLTADSYYLLRTPKKGSKGKKVAVAEDEDEDEDVVAYVYNLFLLTVEPYFYFF